MESVLEVRRKDTLMKKEKTKKTVFRLWSLTIRICLLLVKSLTNTGQCYTTRWNQDFQEQNDSLLQKATKSQGHADQIYIQLQGKPLEQWNRM